MLLKIPWMASDSNFDHKMFMLDDNWHFGLGIIILFIKFN